MACKAHLVLLVLDVPHDARILRVPTGALRRGREDSSSGMAGCVFGPEEAACVSQASRRVQHLPEAKKVNYKKASTRAPLEKRRQRASLGNSAGCTRARGRESPHGQSVLMRSVHAKKPVEYYGKEASAFTKKLTEGEMVRLEYDDGTQRRDRYGRLLAYVYLPDGTFLNAEIIKQGYGFAYTRFPFKYLEKFRQYEARGTGAGLWAQ